eukprot:CAMPEP_0119125700 /NCGR_PEP_ID=MMETSP1310-20130426/4890_1 /TAXON_ID=464262 /ORGANISM="Genus nov. species nov., Strain RCC2339" /LENGTH=97 /DNA_ID=CAMNT_0007115795 /DNA_START=299 /DNA_END=592 /DNA_ORIENTATION=-
MLQGQLLHIGRCNGSLGQPLDDCDVSNLRGLVLLNELFAHLVQVGRLILVHHFCILALPEEQRQDDEADEQSYDQYFQHAPHDTVLEESSDAELVFV